MFQEVLVVVYSVYGLFVCFFWWIRVGHGTDDQGRLQFFIVVVSVWALDSSGSRIRMASYVGCLRGFVWLCRLKVY
jgi:hypothetical protein